MSGEPEQVEGEIVPVLTPEQHLLRVDEHARLLAETLRDASDAGVSHALILPRLMLVFRSAFGEMPPGFKLPGMR